VLVVCLADSVDMVAACQAEEELELSISLQEDQAAAADSTSAIQKAYSQISCEVVVLAEELIWKIYSTL